MTQRMATTAFAHPRSSYGILHGSLQYRLREMVATAQLYVAVPFSHLLFVQEMNFSGMVMQRLLKGLR